MSGRPWLRALRRLRGFGRDDRSVSDVVGSILLVGITVSIITALSVAVLAVEPPDQDRFTEISSSINPGSGGWGEGDETVRILHMGGEPWPQDTARIRVSIDGVVSDFSGASLGGGFADGTFSIGEEWSAEFTIDENATVILDAIDSERNAIVTSARLVPTSAVPGSLPSQTNPTYANSFTATQGSVSSFVNLRSATDSDAVAVLSESTLGGPNVYATNAAGSATDPLAATGAPDNVRATLLNHGDDLVTTGFAAGTGTITTVHAVIEVRSFGLISFNDQVEVLYDDGSPQGASLGKFHPTAAEQEYTFNMTSEMATWTWADISDLSLMAEYAKVGGKDLLLEFQVDALYVRVGLAGTQHEMDIRLDFPAPVAGTTYDLELRYAASGDTFHVDVWDGSSWNTRGDALDQGSLTDWTYTLTASEEDAAGDAPRIRFVDDTPNGPTQGILSLDYVRVRAS